MQNYLSGFRYAFIINKKDSPIYIKEQPMCSNDTENVEKAKKYLSRLSPEKLTKLWDYFYRDHKVFLIFVQSREMIDVMTQYGFDINHTKKSKTSNYFIHPLTTEALAIDYEENIFVSSHLPEDDIDDDTYDGIYRKTSYPYKLTARNLIDFYASDGKQLEIFKHQLETYFYKDAEYPGLLSYVDTLLEAQLLRNNISGSSPETTNISKPKKMTAKI